MNEEDSFLIRIAIQFAKSCPFRHHYCKNFETIRPLNTYFRQRNSRQTSNFRRKCRSNIKPFKYFPVFTVNQVHKKAAITFIEVLMNGHLTRLQLDTDSVLNHSLQKKTWSIMSELCMQPTSQFSVNATDDKLKLIEILSCSVL